MIDFPTNPTIGQVYPPGSVPEGNKQWKWNGQGWELMMYSSAQVVEMARLASNASASAQQAFDNAALSDQSKDAAQEAATTAGSIAGGMENAIAFANTFTSVPATNQGPMVVVTQPHLRFMVWDGVKYVRAPWHRPGIIFHSDGDPTKITHGIQMRSDVVYNTANYPDLAEFYGVTASTFVLKDARARVIRGSDNGRGIDTSLANGSLQEDAIRNITGFFSANSFIGSASGAIYKQSAGGSTSDTGSSPVNNLDTRFVFDASREVPTALENRVKSIVATTYVTI